MVFQLDSNVYSKQKSLSDYMAVNDARNLQRAQAEQSIAASQMAVEAAQQKKAMDTVGMGLAGATPEDYSTRREALIKQGVPPQYLPEQFNPTYVDAVLTKTGYKAKPNIMEQMLAMYSPQGQAAMQSGGFSDMIQPPTQAAAPITPQGSIQTALVGNIDQYASESGSAYPAQGKSINDVVSMAQQSGELPPANNQQMPEPASVPVPQPLPTLQTPIPAPYQPRTPIEALEYGKEKAKGAAENEAKATQPLTPKEQQKRLADYSKLDLGVKQLEQDSQIVSDNIDRAIALLESGKAGGFKSAVGSWVPNSPTGELAGVLETVKGSNIINTLQNIRNSNPTGGAFGNQSDSENKFIGASKGILDPNQSDLTLRNLKVMKANLPLTLKNRREALAKTFPDLYQPPQADSSSNAGNSSLTPAEEKELQRLRERFGIK